MAHQKEAGLFQLAAILKLLQTGFRGSREYFKICIYFELLP